MPDKRAAPKNDKKAIDKKAIDKKAPVVPKTKMARPSLINAAVKVLTEAKGTAMNCTNIVKAAEEKGYWKRGAGLTPQNTLYSNILSELKREDGGGTKSRFKKAGKGLWLLVS